MTGYGVTLAVLPFHIERMALAEGIAAKEASVHVGLITGLFALMQFFFAPLWGKLSDRIGRRPVLMIGMLGFAFANFFFGLGTNLLMFYLSRFLGGSFSAAVLPVSAAIVADLTLESQRGKGMAWMGSAAGFGVMAGPALGGWLAGVNFPRTFHFGYFSFDAFSVPFFVAGILALVALSATIATFVLILTAVFGLGMALLIPILAAMISRHAASNAGTVLGLQNAVNSLGQAMGPLTGGLLFTLSIHLPYLLTGIFLLSSTVLLRTAAWKIADEGSARFR